LARYVKQVLNFEIESRTICGDRMKITVGLQKGQQSGPADPRAPAQRFDVFQTI
jgi:hypothetical protein